MQNIPNGECAGIKSQSHPRHKIEMVQIKHEFYNPECLEGGDLNGFEWFTLNQMRCVQLMTREG